MSKNKDLEIVVENIWHKKNVTILVIIGALELLKKITKKTSTKSASKP